MNNKGFTLIELMITLIIIGILTTLAIPKLSFFQKYAKLSSIKAFAHNLQLSLEAYYMLTGSYPSSTTLDDLLNTLQTYNIMSTIPQNPFTGTSFSSSDPSGKVTYSYTNNTQIYKIIGYDESNVKEIIVLSN